MKQNDESCQTCLCIEFNVIFFVESMELKGMLPAQINDYVECI